MQDSVSGTESPGELVFVVTSLTTGGSERKTVRLVNALTAKGRRVAVVRLNDPDTLRSEIDPRVAVIHLERRGKLSLRALRTLVDIVRARGVTTLVAVNSYPCLYGYLAARRVRSCPLRLVASLNETTCRSKRDARKMWLYAPILRRFDLVLFGADGQRQRWSARYGIGRGGQATEVLDNGVDIDHYSRPVVAPASLPSWPPQRLVVGSVGQFRSEKRQGDLLRAVAALRQTGLDVGAVLVGAGVEKPALERLVATLQIGDAVAVVGEQRDVRPYLARMDVFALPSVETFSNAALEAMSMAVPVVATSAGGMPEMLSEGGGLLYPPGDTTVLEEQLRRLLADASLRETMGQDARRVVERRFSQEAMVAQFERVVLGVG